MASSWAGQPTRAFVPAPHPPALALQDDVRELLRGALLALGHLDAASARLPNPALLTDVWARREALLSCRLAGGRASLSGILLLELGETPETAAGDARQALDAVAAFERGRRQLYRGRALSTALLCELHATLAPAPLADGERAWVLRDAGDAGRPWMEDGGHVPCPGARVAECMTAFERFLRRPAGHGGALAKTALAHAWFEAIGPFPSGNGRLGRLLIPLLLGAQGLLREPLWAPSRWLTLHRDRYYELLRGVREDGDWEAWLAFFAEGVRDTADGCADTLGALAARFAADRTAIRVEIDEAEPALRVHHALERRPVLSVEHAARQTNLAPPAAAAALEAIEKLGIVRALGAEPASRVYGYSGALAELGESGGPFGA